CYVCPTRRSSDLIGPAVEVRLRVVRVEEVGVDPRGYLLEQRSGVVHLCTVGLEARERARSAHVDLLVAVALGGEAVGDGRGEAPQGLVARELVEREAGSVGHG